MRHDVEAFMHLILLRKALGLIFWILIFVGYLLTSKKVNKYTQKNDIDWPIKVDILPSKGLDEAH